MGETTAGSDSGFDAAAARPTRFRLPVAAFAALVIGLMGSIAATAMIAKDQGDGRREERAQQLADIDAGIDLAIAHHLSALRGLEALIEADPDVGPEAFGVYTAALDDHLPAVHALGWVKTPTGDIDGMSITYISPPGFDEAIGFQLAGEPDQRTTLEFAVATDRPAISRPFSLGIADGQVLTIYQAVRSDDGLLLGVVGVALLAEDLMAELDVGNGYSIVDVGYGTAEPIVIHSEMVDPTQGVGDSTNILGRRWELRVDSSGIAWGAAWREAAILGLGLLLTALIVAIVVLQVRAGALAKARARQLSVELREATDLEALASDRLRHSLRNAEIELWERNLTTGAGWSSGAWAQGPVPMETEFWERIHPEDRATVVDDREGLGVIREREFRFRQVDGEFRWVMSRSALIERSGERVLTGVQMDVTDRHHNAEELRRLNSLLKESNDSLMEFTRIAGHDLRSPLRSIGSLCSLIRDDLGAGDPGRIDAHLRRIEQRVVRLLALLDGLLSFASTADPVAPSDIDVRRLLDGIADDLARPSGPRITLETTAPEFVRLELMPFATCARNLIDNAVKHNDTVDGRVAVTTCVRGDTLELVVSDDGPGIHPRYHEQIFEPFRKLLPERRSAGSGVGLSVVRRMAETFGATIDLSSQPGEGATFTLNWPIRAGRIDLTDVVDLDREADRSAADTSTG